MCSSDLRDEIVRILVSLGLAEQSVKLSSHRLPLLDRAGEGVIRHDSLTFGNLPDPLNEGLQLTARTETVAGDPRAGVFPAADSASDSDISWASWESGLMSQLQKFHGGIILGLLAILFGSMGAFVLFMTFRDPPQRTEESPLAIEASPQTGAGRVDSLVLEEVRIVPVQGAVHVRFFTRTEKRFSLHVDPDGDPAMDDRATRWHQLYVKNPRSGRCRVRVLEITDGATVLPSYFWIDSPTSLELETRCLGVQGRLSQLTGVSLSNLVDVERLQSSEAEQDRCFWTGSGPGIIRDLLDRHIPAIDMGAIPIAGLIGTDSMVDRLTERMHSSAPWRQDTNARGDFANIIRLADALLRSGQPRALDAVREYILGGYASWNREHPQVLDYEGLRYWWRIMRRAARYRPALARELLGDLRRHSEQGWAYMLTCFPEEAIPALATIIRGPDHVIRTTTYRGLLDSGIPPELIRPIVDVSRRGSVPEIEQMGACPLLALRCGPSGLDGLESLARTARDAQPNQPIGLFYGIRHLGLNPAGGARLGQFSEAFDSPLVRIRNALDRAWVDRIANRVPPDAPIPVPPISTGLLDPGPDPDPAKVIADDPAGDRLLLAALMQSEAAIPRIRIALEHGNPYLRWVAALALGLTSRPVPVRDPMVHSSQDPEWAVLGAFFARPLETGERLQLLDPTMPGLDIGVTADPGDRVEIRWIGFSSGATPGPDDGGRFVLSQEGLARPEGGSRHIWFGLRCGSQKTILERESGYGFNPGWITISQGGPLIFMAGVRATWHPEDDWLYTTFNQIDETGCVLVRWKLLPGASPDQHRTRTPRSPRGHQRALSFDGQTRRPSQ